MCVKKYLGLFYMTLLMQNLICTYWSTRNTKVSLRTDPPSSVRLSIRLSVANLNVRIFLRDYKQQKFITLRKDTVWKDIHAHIVLRDLP